MPTPGNKSGFAGNSVPLFGESEIQMISTGVDGLTITASTNADANFLTLRANAPYGSTNTTVNKFVVGSSGEYQGRLRTYLLSTGAAASSQLGNQTTAATIGSTVIGGVIFYGGFSSGAKITLPAQEPGAHLLFICNVANASAATLFGGTTGKVQAAGDVAADGVGWNSTAGELNSGIWMISNGTAWNAFPLYGGSTANGGSTLSNLVPSS